MIQITGANGFVGRNLNTYLKKFNIETGVITRSDLENLDNDLLKEVYCIVHLAGKAHDLKQTSDPATYYESNFELTKRLYDAFLISDATKFIFISSVKAAADRVTNELTEDVEPNPQSHYGKSKLMAERYIQSQSLPKGKDFYILRPCMIHGPGNKGNLNLLYQFVKKGIPYPLAAYKNERSFLSVENLCFIIKEIIEHKIPSGIYNVADDIPLSTTDVVRLFAESLQKKSRLWNVPVKIIKLMASVGDKCRLPLNSERLQKLTENYLVSNAKIRMELNENLPLSSTEGLLRTANSFRNK